MSESRVLRMVYPTETKWIIEAPNCEPVLVQAGDKLSAVKLAAKELGVGWTALAREARIRKVGEIDLNPPAALLDV